MKKSLVLIFSLLFILTACGNNKNNSSQANSQNSNQSQQTQNNSKQNSKEQNTQDQGEIKQIGQGQFFLESDSGTTADGSVMTIFDDGKTDSMKVGVVANELDGNKLSYIYIDGKLAAKLQLSDTETTIELNKEDLTVGKHQVVLKQFDNNKEDGTPTTVKVVNYEVVNK